MAELQTIALALECVLISNSVHLFSDSQSTLNACKLELGLVCPNFCNKCWVKRQHIVNGICSKNLKINWHKIKDHSGFLGNKHTDMITSTASLSSWCLPSCLDEHFIVANGSVISGNSIILFVMYTGRLGLVTIGCSIAVMKKTAKVSGSNNGFRPVLSRKKRRGGILKNGSGGEKVGSKVQNSCLWSSETGDTTESNSINIEKKCLIEETSFNYGKDSALTGSDLNQMLTDSKVKTKKALSKPLGKINFLLGGNDNNVLLNSPVLFSRINGFGEVSILSKFAGIIRAMFIFKLGLMKATKKTTSAKIVVNTNLKKFSGCLDWTVVLKKIPVKTLAEAFEHSDHTDLVTAKWFILIRKDTVHIARSNMNKKFWDVRNVHKTLLYTLPMGTNGHNIWDYVVSMGRKTCVIDYYSVFYAWTKYATVCFDLAESLNTIMRTTLVLRSANLCWFCLVLAKCLKCENSGHMSLNCITSGKSVFSDALVCRIFLDMDKSRLSVIYTKCSTLIVYSVSFGGVSWVKIVGGFFFFSLFVHSSLAHFGSFLEMESSPPMFLDLNVRFAALEHRADIVISKSLDVVTSSKTIVEAVIFDPLTISKIEKTLNNLSITVMDLLAKIDNASLQDDIVHWHKNINNLISIFMETKLKKKIHLWIVNKFGDVHVFTFGLNFAHLESGVAVVINNSLVRHVYKISEKIVKTIDYIFVSSNLVSALVYCDILDVSEHFDTNHQTVFVSVSLGGLLNAQLNSLYKQVNIDYWKFDIKGADKIKWGEFKVLIAANAAMFSDKFVFSVVFSDLDSISSRFHKLEILISRIVKTSYEKNSVRLTSLIDHWTSLDPDKALAIQIFLNSDSLEYVFDSVFLDVIHSIDFDELFDVISDLLNDKTAGLSGILNEL
ncbi:hypothetical protein G9A89_012395 [Geosiphon pyriformis]|nr:hypothetical protein G9A89_012395 [Geosiphon pyriformis]